MKIAKLPKAETKIEVAYISALGIQSYDRDNLYPQNVMAICQSSKTGNACLERFRDFMEGDGLASSLLSEYRVNRQGETLGDIHSLISQDLATFNGFALHVNYNAFGKISDLHWVPFENVRLEEADEEGVIKRVAIHPDWSGKSTRGGRRVKVSRETVDFLDVFNPDPEIVAAQIVDAGGITQYKGQVLYVSTAGHLRYPLAKYDSVLTDMSTDEGLSNLTLRNARNNFLPAGAFVHFRSQDPDADGFAESEYDAALRSLQGDTNALNILDIEVETKEEMPEFVSFAGRNIDKDFTASDASVKESIYSQFGQEAFLAVRLGKMGFSGSLMKDANDDYARRCVKLQKRITRAFYQILSQWATPLPDMINYNTLAVLPLTYSVATIDAINE